MTAIASTAPPVFDTGAESCPQGQLPGRITFTAAEERTVMNPLQHLPVVGMIYRAFNGGTMPAPVQIADSLLASAALGGPLGLVGMLAVTFVSELAALGPDTSRPPVPEGMDATGSEAGVRTVSPGSIVTAGGYTTLATTLPAFLPAQSATMVASTGAPPVVTAALAAYDWQCRAMMQQGMG